MTKVSGHMQVNKEDSRFRHLMAAQLNAASADYLNFSPASAQEAPVEEEVRA